MCMFATSLHDIHMLGIQTLSPPVSARYPYLNSQPTMSVCGTPIYTYYTELT